MKKYPRNIIFNSKNSLRRNCSIHGINAVSPKTCAPPLPPPPPPPPTILTFTATPNPLNTHAGEIILAWTTQDATSASLNQGFASVSINEVGLTASPSFTLTYKLTASGPGGSTFTNLLVTVNTTPVPPVVDSFTVFPTTINEGDSAVLKWLTTDATTVFIDNDVGTFAPGDNQGGHTVSPTVTTTYNMSAIGPEFPIGTDEVTLTVIPA